MIKFVPIGPATIYYTTSAGNTETIATTAVVCVDTITVSTADLVEALEAIDDKLDGKKPAEREPREPLPRPPKRITYEGRHAPRPGQKPSTYG